MYAIVNLLAKNEKFIGKSRACLLIYQLPDYTHVKRMPSALRESDIKIIYSKFFKK